jgi:hypothetical protein
MKTTIIGGGSLFCVLALTSPAFCRAPLFAATVNGNMSVTDGPGGILDQPLPSAGSVEDGVFADKTLDVQDISQGDAFITFSGSAHAGGGILGVQAFAAANATYPSSGPVYAVDARISVGAEADLLDTLTFAPPTSSMLGDYFQVEAHWNLDGSLSGIPTTGIPTGDMTWNTTASAGATLDVSGTGITIGLGGTPIAQDSTFIDYAGNVTHYITPTPSTIPVVIDGYWGVPMNVDYHLSLGASAAAATSDILLQQSAAAIGMGDFSHTMSWGGISSITDNSGNPITGWSVTSASGFDYSKPAPEPSTLILGGLGALTLAMARLRKTQRRRQRFV